MRLLREIKIRVFLFSRKDRRERKGLFSFGFHACAGVVANFVTTRVRREFYPPPPPLRGTLSEPDVKLRSLTLIRHKMTMSHFSKGLIRPVSGVESVTTETLR